MFTWLNMKNREMGCLYIIFKITDMDIVEERKEGKMVS